jgi:S-formylglutathione hydrolase FrmB
MRGTLRSTIRASLAVAVAAGAMALVPLRGADAAPAPDGPRLESFSLASPLIDTSAPGGLLEHHRRAPKVNVLLPAGYDDHPDRRYPVLWLLHGANGGTDTWIPSITRLAPGFPGIIVMPDGGVFGMYTDWWNGGTRGNPGWATYHLQVLRQVVEQRYRIRPERRWHAIGGISMGGQGALRYAAMLPGYFGSVATFSAAFPDTSSPFVEGGIGLLQLLGHTYGADYQQIWGPEAAPYAKGYSPMALVENLADTRIYLTSGWGLPCGQDPLNRDPQGLATDAVTEALLHLQQAPFTVAARQVGADVTQVTTCGIHTFGVWDRAIPAALAWGLFGAVPDHPATWRYRTIATSGEAWGLRFRFTRPPEDLVELRRDGRWLSASGTGEITIEGGAGCRFRTALPFTRALPPGCP